MGQGSGSGKDSQRARRRGIDIGAGLTQVSPAMYWYRHGHFRSDDEARGAFRLAHQQGLDGLGPSTQAWMGMTDEEFAAWMREDALPPMKAGPRPSSRGH